MAKPSRLTDIAKACGVSTAAVSRILNGDKGFSARPETCQKVRETAARLGYVPDLSARNLNRHKTGIIGVFGSPFTHIGRGFNDLILDGAAKVLHKCDHDLFYEVSRRSADGPALPFWRFDGAILLPAPQARVIEELDRRQVPYVCVNENIGKAAAAVLTDDAQGMLLALEHLYSLGHRTIGYANANPTYFEHYSIGERHGTLVDWARKRRVTLARGHDQPFSAPAKFLHEAVIVDHATALITYDHLHAVSILGTAQSMGLSIPRDLSLICFNDEFPVSLLHPGLTVIAVAGERMGQLAAEHLLKAMAAPTVKDHTVLMVPEALIVRASTTAPR